MSFKKFIKTTKCDTELYTFYARWMWPITTHDQQQKYVNSRQCDAEKVFPPSDQHKRMKKKKKKIEENL